MNMRGRAITILLIILAVVAGAIYWQQTPRLIEFSPSDGEINVFGGEPIRLVFSKSMDRNSVESHLVIEPDSTGTFSWEENTLIFTPDRPWQNSAVIQVKLSKGARSNEGLKLPTYQDKSWSFTVEDPLLAYLYPSDSPAQIYTLNLHTGDIKQLTDVAGDILDYCISPSGTILFFSVNLGGEGTGIYQIDRMSGNTSLVLDCPQATCHSPQVSPDGELLAFEDTPFSQTGTTGKTQVWMIPLTAISNIDGNHSSQAGIPSLIGDPNHQTQLPLWSSKGLLVYYDFTDKAYIVSNTEGEETARFPSETGLAGSWHPDGESFIFPEFVTDLKITSTLSDLEAIPSSHLLLYSLDDETPNDLTDMDYLEDSAPAFSPDGKWLVFARKYLDITNWTPGRQIWIMAIDGETANSITNEPHFNHYSFAWDPSGSQIAYVRFDQTEWTAPPEIWLTKLDSSGGQRLIRNGYAPQWIP